MIKRYFVLRYECCGTSACSSGDSGAYSRSSYIRSDGCDGGGDDSSGDGCDDGSGGNSGGTSEQMHYSQQVDLLQKALLLLPWLSYS